VRFTTFCECVWLFHEICSTQDIDAELFVLIEASLAEPEVSVLRTVPSFVKYY
jgi:hypothetical protein